MSTNGCDIETPAAEPAIVGLTLLDAQLPVLARIPDLSAMGAAASRHAAAVSDGRLFNQRLSNKLIVGGAVLVALAAVLPFLPLRRGRRCAASSLGRGRLAMELDGGHAGSQCG